MKRFWFIQNILKNLKNKVFVSHHSYPILNSIPMENSTFTEKELAQWNTLKYICSNNSDIFKILISVVPYNILNGVVDGKNLLFVACGFQHESVKHLLDCERFTDANINAINKDGQTAMCVACEFQPKAVEYLMECSRFTDENVNKMSCEGNNALHRACIFNPEIVPYLLKNNRLTEQSINAKNIDGSTALHWACEFQPDAIEHLLNCDKFTAESINTIEFETGNSVLHYACGNENSKTIDQLLSSNKLTIETIGKINACGCTALDVARERHTKETVDRLMNYIEKLNDDVSQNNKQNTDLDMINLQIENTELKRTIAQLELKILELSK